MYSDEYVKNTILLKQLSILNNKVYLLKSQVKVSVQYNQPKTSEKNGIMRSIQTFYIFKLL